MMRMMMMMMRRRRRRSRRRRRKRKRMPFGVEKLNEVRAAESPWDF